MSTTSWVAIGHSDGHSLTLLDIRPITDDVREELSADAERHCLYVDFFEADGINQARERAHENHQKSCTDMEASADRAAAWHAQRAKTPRG
jgi:hypothetical protein